MFTSKKKLLTSKMMLAVGSFLLTVFMINWVLGHLSLDYQFMKMVFADSFSAPKFARLHVADNQRIFKLTSEPNGNIYGKTIDRTTWNVDEFGFRPDYRSNTDRDAKTIVILMIGDSFTYGSDISHFDVYPSVVEKKFLDEGYNVNVVNAGVAGYGPDQELIYLRQLLPKVKPDYVVWNVYENDVTDTNYYCLFTVKDKRLHQLPAVLNNVYRQGAMVNAVPLKVAQLPLYKLAVQVVGYPYGGTKEIPISTFGCTQKITPAAISQFYEKLELILQQAQIDTKAAGSEIIFTLMPTQRNFVRSKNSEEEVLEAESIANYKLFLTTPFFDLNTSFLGISNNQRQSIDISSTLFFSAKEEPQLYAHHLNPTGNRIAADMVFNYLKTFPKLKKSSP